MDGYTAAYKRMFENYFVVNGRASRYEFCGALFVNIAVGLILGMISWLLPIFFFIDWLYGAAVVIPLTTLTIRRLHDTDHTGWWVLVGCVPLLNFGLVVYCCLAEGTVGRNSYGR